MDMRTGADGFTKYDFDTVRPVQRKALSRYRTGSSAAVGSWQEY